MSNLSQIPLGCAINVAIIQEVSKSEAFINASISIPLQFGITPPVPGIPWPFFNPSWGGYMMYSLFIVPKELYKLDKSDSFYSNLIELNAMEDFIILKEKHNFNDDPLYQFKSFRNSISHVNYEILDDKIKFWDHPIGKPEPENWHWEIEINWENFFIFLGKVANAHVKFYIEIKEGKRDQNGNEI